MSKCIRPLSEPERSINLSELLVEALASEIARHSGGHPVLDRLEAEAWLDQSIGPAWRGGRHERKEKDDGRGDASTVSAGGLR
jgi:hypothetical protein